MLGVGTEFRMFTTHEEKEKIQCVRLLTRMPPLDKCTGDLLPDEPFGPTIPG